MNNLFIVAMFCKLSTPINFCLVHNIVAVNVEYATSLIIYSGFNGERPEG